MPTAVVLPDGHVAVTTSMFENNQRHTLTFQVLPRVYGTFRYSILRNLVPTGPNSGDVFDRSFDVHVQLLEERSNRPALAFGLRDIAGTSIFSSEYVVASKSIGPNLRVTGGLGWGRLAQRGSFANPLGILSSGFDTRAPRATTGQLAVDSFFQGPVAFFGGADIKLGKRLSLQFEYSSDAYDRERSVGNVNIDSPINLGLTYQFDQGPQLRGYLLGGTTLGLQFSYMFDPAKRPVPGGRDKAPVPFTHKALLKTADLGQPDALQKTQARLFHDLKQEGLVLQGFDVRGTRALVRIENQRWDVEAQAVGRAARRLARVLPMDIEIFEITLQQRGVPHSTVTLKRSDLVEVALHHDGAWRSLSRTRFADAPDLDRTGEPSQAFPVFDYSIGPYVALSFFDPDQPVRADAGVQVNASYRPSPGLTFSGVFRQPLIGNIDEATRVSDSVLPRVRSDAVLYAQQSDFEINELTAEYMFRPGDNLFGRVTGGYLESMFGGVSAELLWFPIESRLALGAELNYARQRDFDMLLGFQGYDVLTGHGSVYYDLGNGFTTQLDVGRYLAGDWGATFSLAREFNNGFKIGGFFTLTDVPFSQFGEGSFDRGITVEIPISWFTGRSSRRTFRQVIRPLQRDGGARLNVSNRLYGVTRDYRAQRLSAGWGRVFR
ncbi:YjbH domain-containing protein [Roseovarius sp. S88]|uniref:YjbH domain-containing protein n=2 Tax=Roseovarius phycicola TaxID=3080976 RepID=A0ABZ2HH86_9RHOB